MTTPQHDRWMSADGAEPRRDLQPGKSTRVDRAVTPQVPGRQTLVEREAYASANSAAPNAPTTLWQQLATTLYRLAQHDGEVDAHDPAVDESLRAIGGGETLPHGVRQDMEAEFGVSFARVRIHTDGSAAAAATAVRARAFTVGEDIFFAHGAYAPDSAAGRKLLAHELTHVVQSMQGRTGNNGGRAVSDPNDSLEHEAESRADRIGSRARPDARALARPAAAPAAGTSRLLRKAAEPSVAAAPRDHDAIAPPHAPDVPAAATSSALPKLAEIAQRSTQYGSAHAQHIDTAIATMERASNPRSHAALPVEHDAHTHAGASRIGHDHHARAAAHAPSHHGALAEPATANAGHGPIEFKKIDDWHKFLPPHAAEDPHAREKLLEQVKAKVAKERAEGLHVFESLRAAELAAADKVRRLAPKLTAEIEHGRQRALGQVSASEASRAASIQAHAAGVSAHVQGTAAAMKAQVTAAHARTVAQINHSLQQATQEVTRDHTQALQASHTEETAQIATVAAKFTAAKAKIVALGAEMAGKASGLGDSTPLAYSGAKLTAARKAARQVATQYAHAMPPQASKAATNVGHHEHGVDQAVHTIGNETRKHIDAGFHHATRMLQATHKQALATADQARTAALQQIGQMAATGVAQIGGAAASQVASVHSQAATARGQITHGATSGIAALGKGCTKAIKDLDAGVQKIVHAARGIEVPNADELKHKSAHSIADFHKKEHSLISNLTKAAASSSKGLESIGSSTAHSLAQTAAQANATTSQIGAGASQQIAQAASQAEQTLRQVADGFEKRSQQLAKATGKSLHELNTGEQREYKNETTKLEKGLERNYTGIQHSFDQVVPGKEVPDIQKNAAKAAAQVHSGGGFWHSVLHWVAFVAIVVIVIVVVIALSVLTDGIADVFLADASPWALAAFNVVAETVAGAVSNEVQTILGNVWLQGAGWSQGWKGGLLQGAAGGALSAGLAVGSEAFLAGKFLPKVSDKLFGSKLGGLATGLKDALEDGAEGFSWHLAANELFLGAIGSVAQGFLGGWSWSGFIENLAGNAGVAGAVGHGGIAGWEKGLAYSLTKAKHA